VARAVERLPSKHEALSSNFTHKVINIHCETNELVEKKRSVGQNQDYIRHNPTNQRIVIILISFFPDCTPFSFLAFPPYLKQVTSEQASPYAEIFVWKTTKKVRQDNYVYSTLLTKYLGEAFRYQLIGQSKRKKIYLKVFLLKKILLRFVEDSLLRNSYATVACETKISNWVEPKEFL
jgi:hypothetical protein